MAATFELNVTDLAQAVGNEMKSLRTLLNGNAADLSSLTTTQKNTVVAAINEVNAAVEALATSPGGATIDDTQASSSTVYSSSKSTSVAQAAAAAIINDTTAQGSTAYSSTKTNAQITSAVAQVKSDILGGAGAAYDTLQELKTLLDQGDAADQAAITNLTTALGNRVRFDAAQTLTDAQKAQAIANIGAISAASVGDPTTNFVTVFQNALS